MQDGFYAYLTGEDPEKAFAKAMVDSGVLDENNWFTPLAFVKNKGGLTLLTDKPDYRILQLRGLSRRRCWNEALRLASAIASTPVAEIFVQMVPAFEGFKDSSPLNIFDEALALLKSALVFKQSDPSAAEKSVASDATVNEAWQLVNMLEQGERVGPFCPEVYDPYAPVRACVLTEGMTLDHPDAHILFVRIHT